MDEKIKNATEEKISYSEEEVFESINKFLGNSREDIEKAFKIHRKLVSLVPEEIKEESYFRYLPKGGTIGLNIKNYKIYEYHHKERESFRVIYPKDKVSRLEDTGYSPIIDFEFVSTPAVLLEVPVKEFDKFTENEWNNIRKAMIEANKGKDNVKNIRNIEIQW